MFLSALAYEPVVLVLVSDGLSLNQRIMVTGNINVQAQKMHLREVNDCKRDKSINLSPKLFSPYFHRLNKLEFGTHIIKGRSQ
jgi:hypothetical protein